jgi:acyl-CoA dehydrogenase
MADKSYLNWPFFDARHRALVDELETWIDEAHELNEPMAADTDSHSKQFVSALASGGWLRHAAPEEGKSLDVRSLCLLRETLARHHGLIDFAFAMQGLGTGPITLFGTSEQRERYLPAVASGTKIAAFALSETDAGSDAAALTTTARFDGDKIVLDGEKMWISNGGIAHFYVVFARTGEAPGAKGISAIIVDANTPGLLIGSRIPLIAPHPMARLEFHDVRVPATNLIGKAGEGFKIAMATLDVFRSTVGAAALGMARRALDETLKRAKTRQINGAPMAELQMVQAMIADMALKIDAAALLIYRAAWTKDSGAARVTREAAMAKLYATDTAQEVIDAAVQLHGGWGVVHGHPVECLYRDIRALRIYEGASEVQKVIIARNHLAAHKAAAESLS